MGEERDRLVDDVPVETDTSSEETNQRPTLDRGRYIPTKDAAELLGVNRATVINWARQGKFGGVQYGVRGIYRFDRQELLDFIGRSRIPYPQGGEDQTGADAGL